MATKKPAAKKSPAKKQPAKKKTGSVKQQKLKCKDCGLVLSVDELCGCKDLSDVTCCGAPMKGC